MRSRFATVFSGLMLVAGCGTSDYESKFEASLTALRNEVPFESLWQKPVSIPLSAAEKRLMLKVRIPRLFNTKTGESYALDQNTPDPRNQEVPIASERVWPTFLHVGTHLRTYEQTLTLQPVIQNVSRLPLHCYIAVASAAQEGALGKVMDKLRAKLENQFKNAAVATEKPKRGKPKPAIRVGDWMTLRVPTPEGEQQTVEKIEATGYLALPYYEAPGTPDLKKTTFYTECVIYLVPCENETVILAWIMPVGLAQRKNIDTLTTTIPLKKTPVARAMAGTVEITELPPESPAEPPVATD